ncbi:MAG TPA: SusD/RagB family nutrient-binding outer membrane lipoprotein, partial [Puia sp.]|nr:SusD/RagB family nutrient-binding outer membrane lipoprotein [Puia sp.]
MLFNKNKVAGYLAVGSILLSIGACTKKLDSNLNNPNGVTTNVISGKDVFASALQNTVFSVNATPPTVTVGISTLTNEWMGIWARTTSYSASGAQYLVETFTLNNAFGDNFWGYMYHNMADYNFVASKSEDGSILPGASLVMQCLVFQDLTDIFGDIPYSQALNTKYGQPVYDKAADIYASLPLRLDSAMALINASKATSDDAADVMFKGNKASWLAFANTVKLRILLRQIPVAATAASLQAEMAKTASYGFLIAGQNAVVNPGYKDATNQQSPFWSIFGYQVASPNVYQNQTFYIANQT